jgi:hypothetical protein
VVVQMTSVTEPEGRRPASRVAVALDGAGTHLPRP